MPSFTDPKRKDPLAALQGLQSAAPEQGGANAIVPQNSPAESADILRNSPMLSNAANQNTLGGFGSLEEVRRATQPGRMWESRDAFGRSNGMMGVGRAPTAQAYAQGILGAHNASLARAAAANEKVADMEFAEQFTQPHERQASIYKAGTALDPTVTRAAEADAARSPAALQGRANIRVADINASAEADKARASIYASGRGSGNNSDPFVSGAFNMLQEIGKALGPNEYPMDPADRQNLLVMQALLMQALGLGGGPQAPATPGPQPQQAPLRGGAGPGIDLGKPPVQGGTPDQVSMRLFQELMNQQRGAR